MIIRSLKFFIVFALLLLASNVSAQADPFLQNLRELELSVTTIQSREILDDSLKKTAREISDSSRRLRELYDAEKKGVSAAYLDSLVPYIRVLKKFAGKTNIKKIDPKLRTALLELNDELHIKIKYAENLRGGSFSNVTVVVETTKSGSPAGEYEVWYVPLGWKDSSDRHQRFDNLSTPTIKALPPGNYLFWARKGREESNHLGFSIGEDGQTKRRIEIEVP